MDDVSRAAGDRGHVSHRSHRGTRWLGLGGVVGPVMFVVAFTAAGTTRPGYSPVRQPVSDLGVGAEGWQLNVPLVVLGLLLVAFSVGFLSTFAAETGRPRPWLPAGLLMVPGLGFAFAGIFPLPNPIHWLAGATLVFLGSIPAFFITGRLLRRDPAWRPWGTYAVVTGAATAALVAAMFALANPDSPAASLPITGLAERAVFAVMLAWYVATGWRVFRDLPQASRRRSP